MVTLSEPATPLPPPNRNKARGRPRGRPSAAQRAVAASSAMTDPPLKKRKYVPGGPGGGGRYIEVDGSETPVGGTGPGGYAYTGPRPRPRPRGGPGAGAGAGAEARAQARARARVQARAQARAQGAPARASAARESALDAASSPSTSLRRREAAPPTPRYSSAAAVVAAVVQGDGYKPREERGWEEIHPQLDTEAKFAVYGADEVDGTRPDPPSTDAPSSSAAQRTSAVAAPAVNGIRTDVPETPVPLPSPAANGDVASTPDRGAPEARTAPADGSVVVFSQPKRRVGRPPRRPDAATINGVLAPCVPKVVPPPGPNPRERLTLPKPSFRRVDPFASFEHKSTGQVRYVDRSMANVGYQETDFFPRPERFVRYSENAFEEDLDLVPGLKGDGDRNTALGGAGVGRVEYDMDEQDDEWLAAYNDHRKSQEVEAITREVFEITLTKIEKEWYALEKRRWRLLSSGSRR